MLKFKFNSQMPHQQAAVQAVIGLFKGQSRGSFELQGPHAHGQVTLFPGQGNNLSLSDDELLKNAQQVQKANALPPSTSLSGRNFSVEMETGTGKTYVYIKTLLELHKQYDFKKFIIVVPSVAIRAGLVKSFQIMKEHLEVQYGSLPQPLVYSRLRLNRVREFKNSADLQIMILNIQSFIKDTAESGKAAKSNVIHRYDDMMGGRAIEFIQSVKPIVIVDEPQSVDSTPKSQAALAKLHPSAVLRYSATHRHKHTMLYQLGPVQAYNQNLVKSIEVASVCADKDPSRAYVEYIKGDNANNKIKAQLSFYKKTKSGDKKTQQWFKQHDDLYKKSNQHPAYKNGFILKHIDIEKYVEFENTRRLWLNQQLNPRPKAVTDEMLRETIDQHFQKELALKSKNIKVLSLFFIDRVSDYREHLVGGADKPGPLAKRFESIYAQVAQKYSHHKHSDQRHSDQRHSDQKHKDQKHSKSRYKGAWEFKADQVHNGYFSKDKKGVYKDTQGSSQSDESTYAQIMVEKEKLLDPNEPLRFIFSHTALKEGWDNPNVFQICTLRNVSSQMQRRQQIGRGLRLAVDAEGHRVEDPHVNRLTVVSSEAYSEYAVGLQNEYEQECGVKFDAPIRNAHERKKLKLNEDSYLNEDFKKLWDKVQARTRYRVFFKGVDFVQELTQQIATMPLVPALKVSISKAQLSLSKKGVQAQASSTDLTKKTLRAQTFPNLVQMLSQKTYLTRASIAKALIQSQRLDDFIKNPYDFIDKASAAIESFMARFVLGGLKYEKVDDDAWQITRFQDEDNRVIESCRSKIYRIKNSHKSLYDGVVWDSQTEEKMAQDLDVNEHVKFFIKLPSWFKIDTPVGAYNPDWAFVTHRSEKLYFVRETKSTLDARQWRVREKHKVDCGRKHFDSIGTNFDVVTQLEEVEF